MNSLIESVNGWAESAARLGWPMLWQSSLLIGVVLALDLLLRRKLRVRPRSSAWACWQTVRVLAFLDAPDTISPSPA